MISLRKLFQQKFEGHKGRPGQVGGSQPKSGGTIADKFTPEQKAKMRAELGKKKSPEVRNMIDLAGIDMVGGHLDFRQLGERGYHPVTSNILPSVGDEIDFYDNNGDKQNGIIMKFTGDEIKIAPSENGRFDQKKPITRRLVDWKTGKPVG